MPKFLLLREGVTTAPTVWGHCEDSEGRSALWVCHNAVRGWLFRHLFLNNFPCYWDKVTGPWFQSVKGRAGPEDAESPANTAAPGMVTPDPLCLSCPWMSWDPPSGLSPWLCSFLWGQSVEVGLDVQGRAVLEHLGLLCNRPLAPSLWGRPTG